MLLFGRAGNDSCCRHELSAVLQEICTEMHKSVLIHAAMLIHLISTKTLQEFTSRGMPWAHLLAPNHPRLIMWLRGDCLCLLPREVVSNRLPVTLHPDRPPPNDVEQLLLCKHAASLVLGI